MSFGDTDTIGTLSSAPDGSIVNHIFDYVSTILVDFKASSVENENTLTNRLCIILNQHKPEAYPYFFHHQNLENEVENTSTDFAVFGTLSYTNISSTSALIKFEAKRLSTDLPKRREREYIIGEYLHGEQLHNTGGIERFKNERHGQDVNIAGLIGYVQTESFSYWFDMVNAWIQSEIESSHDKSLHWDEDDKIKLIKSGKHLASYKSKSRRISKGIIELRHLWINIT